MSKLPGKKPKEILKDKRFKAFFYGEPSSGKTFTAIQFPNPYVIDTEKGCENKDYIEKLENNNGLIYQTNDFDDVLRVVKMLLTEKHPYKTLIIDPMTTIYSNLLDTCANKLAKKSKDGNDGTENGRHYNEAGRKMKHLGSLLVSLDMNVIVTSHAKALYGPNLSLLGNTFDCYKKLDYLFDLMLETQRRGTEYFAIVKKSRLSKEFPINETLLFSYEEVASRYGREILERDAICLVTASAEQLMELKRLIDLLKVEETSIDKWLAKANSSSLEELPADTAQKIIDHLLEKINGKDDN